MDSLSKRFGSSKEKKTKVNSWTTIIIVAVVVLVIIGLVVGYFIYYSSAGESITALEKSNPSNGDLIPLGRYAELSKCDSYDHSSASINDNYSRSGGPYSFENTFHS